MIWLVACNHSPEIRTMKVTPHQALVGDDLEVLIEVVDLDGPLDLVSARVDLDGAEIARFHEDGVAGTYVAWLDGAVVQGRLADFAHSGEAELVAVVSDLHAERARRIQVVEFRCPTGDGLCDGVCIDFDPDHYCGNVDFGTPSTTTSVVGVPVGWTRCEEAPEVPPLGFDCDKRCRDLDLSCGDGCATDASGYWYVAWGAHEEECQQLASPTYAQTLAQSGGDCRAPVPDGDWVRCCCVE